VSSSDGKNPDLLKFEIRNPDFTVNPDFGCYNPDFAWNSNFGFDLISILSRTIYSKYKIIKHI
jgi:hypothetical protein